MNRDELKNLIAVKYGCDGDHPWIKYPTFEVFRHASNKKWFALIMSIPKNKLGLDGTDYVDVVNLKCDTVMICDMLSEAGIYPAYHMNKDNWLTVALDGSANDTTLSFLLDNSYEMTRVKIGKRKEQ